MLRPLPFLFRASLTVLAAVAVAPAARAQVVLRDTIVPLPPFSICQDGATHRTTCTNVRLRPGSLTSLTPFENQPVEITGTAGAITCAFVTVQTITALPNDQFARTTIVGTTMTAEFLGAGPTGDVYLLFLSAGLLTNPTALPNVIGPVHLDPASAVFVGLYVPLGATTPYHTITLPLNPALQNVDFFDQALALHAGGGLETTRVDCFRF